MKDALLVAFLLTLGTASSLAQLMITHAYPSADNFSYVTLTCRDGPKLVNGAQFQLNASSIDNVYTYTNDGSGAISIVLTQEKEGEFSCSYDDRLSDTIALAGTYDTLYILQQERMIKREEEERVTSIQSCTYGRNISCIL